MGSIINAVGFDMLYVQFCESSFFLLRLFDMVC
jgi:hypothetical protein